MTTSTVSSSSRIVSSNYSTESSLQLTVPKANTFKRRLIYKSALLLTASVMVAGCNDNMTNAGGDDNKQPAIISAPKADTEVSFTIHPYLQHPTSDRMSVLFESDNAALNVWARPAGSQGEFQIVEAFSLNQSSLHSSTLTGLNADTLYEYFVVSGEPSTGGGIIAVSPRYTFKSYPELGQAPESFNVIAISDTQNNSTLGVLSDLVGKGIVTHVCDDQPEQCASNIAAITISGDIVNNGNSLLQWRRDFFDQLKNITPYVPLVAVPGNHDYYGNPELSNYKHFFQQPENGSVGYEEQWYTLDYGNLRMIGLDSYPISKNHGDFQADILGIQRQWLREKLVETEVDNNIDFVVSMFHHPCLSELWLSGESIGSCEIVAEMEDFTRRSGKMSGHFFGHTHAYSRGQSMDINHLWLNAATAAGYREQINNENYYNEDTRDYDTFAISRSEFGFNLLTFSNLQSPSISLTRYSAEVASKGDGLASLKDNFTISDTITMKRETVESPQILEGDGNLRFNNLKLAITHPEPESIYEVQWQFGQDSNFEQDVFDIWGNKTRRHNIWPIQDGTIEGKPTDTQANVDLTRIDLADFSSKVKMGGDEVYKWQKRPSEHSHYSYRDPFKGSSAPVLTIFPGETWYWRARVRDKHLSWSDWSSHATLSIAAGTTSSLEIKNAGAEQNALTDWSIDMGYWRVASDMDDILASEGTYYFSARPNDSAAGDAPYDEMHQQIDVSQFGDAISNASAFIKLRFSSNGWGDGDHAVVTLQPQNSIGDAVGEAIVVKTASRKQQWLVNEAVGLLPEDTVSLKLSARAVKQSGSMSDVHLDDFQVTLTTP